MDITLFLPARWIIPPPLQVVDFVYRYYEDGSIWWQLEVKAEEDDESLFHPIRRNGCEIKPFSNRLLC